MGTEAKPYNWVHFVWFVSSHPDREPPTFLQTAVMGDFGTVEIELVLHMAYPYLSA